MADRKDYHFRQKVTEAELDAGFDDLEAADRNEVLDRDLVGTALGTGVTPNDPADLTVLVASGAVYDQEGRRIHVPTEQQVDCSVDEDGNSTAIVSEDIRWLSIFAEFDRELSDPRTDGDGNEVFFTRAESFKLNVAQGPEQDVFDSPIKPGLRSDQVLLADVRLQVGQNIDANDIFLDRRQYAFSIPGDDFSISEGTAKAAIQALLDIVDELDGSDIAFDPSGFSWANGTSLNSTTVGAGINHVVEALGDKGVVHADGGAAKVGYVDGGATWADGAGLVADNVRAAVDEVVGTIGATTGAAKVGTAGSGDLSQADVETNLGEIDGRLADLESDTHTARLLHLSPANATIENAADWNITFGEMIAQVDGAVAWLSLPLRGGDRVRRISARVRRTTTAGAGVVLAEFDGDGGWTDEQSAVTGSGASNEWVTVNSAGTTGDYVTIDLDFGSTRKKGWVLRLEADNGARIAAIYVEYDRPGA